MTWKAARPGMLVHREFRPRLVAWLEQCSAAGLDVVVVSAWRDSTKQKLLYETYLRNKATYDKLLEAWIAGGKKGMPPRWPLPAAAPGSSTHEFGVGSDYSAGSKVENEEAGVLAEALGLRWGGRFADPIHVDDKKRIDEVIGWIAFKRSFKLEDLVSLSA